MSLRTKILTSIGCLACAAGCSIAGSWKTIDIDPPGRMFPVETITFDQDHNYTATWSQDGETRTTLGRYQWNGFRLDVLQPGNRTRSYATRLDAGNKLTMIYGKGTSKIKATLKKVDH